MDLILHKPKEVEIVYSEIAKKITENLPQIQQDMEIFGKTQSQFMDNMLTVTSILPIRNVRQISAEINKANNALNEAYFKRSKKLVKIKKMKREIEKSTDQLDKEMLELSIGEIEMQISSMDFYIKGAMRKISAYMEQYKRIMDFLGK